MSGTSRRQFLTTAIAAGMAAEFPGPFLAAAQTEDNAVAPGKPAQNADMPRRILGKTKESVTILGLGCAYAGGGVDEAATRAVIETALEGGIRYFDSAPEYVQAEERLGPVITGVRKDIFLTTKTYAMDAAGAEADLHKALKNLKTGHVDLFLQHGVGLDSVSKPGLILGKGGSLEYLQKANKEGLTRFIGMSVHPPHSTALALLEASEEWDVIMPFVNYVARAKERLDPPREDLFEKAARLGIGIVAMKVLGGHPAPLAKEYDRAFRYALSMPAVACALIGARNTEQVKRAVRAAKEFRPFTPAEMEETLRKGDEIVINKALASRVLYQHRQRDYRTVAFL